MKPYLDWKYCFPELTAFAFDVDNSQESRRILERVYRPVSEWPIDEAEYQKAKT